MKKLFFNPLIITLLLILSSYSINAATTIPVASLQNLTARNTPNQVSITAPGHSTISWRMDLETSGFPPPPTTTPVFLPTIVTVKSVSGIFKTPNGIVLGTVSRQLLQTKSLQLPIGFLLTPYLFTESLSIPLNIIRSAQQKGFSQFTYERSFSDSLSTKPITGRVTFSITGSGAAVNLTIERVAMRFDDNRITGIITEKSQLAAIAEINYLGTGLLNYRWEVASPPSTLGQPVFIPTTTRRIYLAASGRTVLTSPDLPSHRSGEYLVRLVIIKPKEILFELPVLRYSVNPNKNRRQEHLLNLISPGNKTVLTPATQFKWHAVKDTKTYQLEIFAKKPVRDDVVTGNEAQKPIAGLLTEKTQAVLESVSWKHFESGINYFWRILAIHEDGSIIGRSDFRQLIFQHQKIP